MNLHLELRTTVAELPVALKKAEPTLTYAEGEEETKPRTLPVKAIVAIAEHVGELSDGVLVTVSEHRTLVGEHTGHSHVTVTVSKMALPQEQGDG